MPYRIVYAEEIRAHLRSLTARQPTIVFDSIEEQLTHEPTTETRNRKEMVENSLASWELRIGDLRVYYDVTEDPQTVAVVAVGIKRRNRILAAPGKFETKCSASSAVIRTARWPASEQFCLELRGCCLFIGGLERQL